MAAASKAGWKCYRKADWQKHVMLNAVKHLYCFVAMIQTKR